MLISILEHLYALLLIPFYIVYNSVKALVPYKLRSKSVASEVVLVTGAGQILRLGFDKNSSIKFHFIRQVVVLVKVLQRNWLDLEPF
jgi:hypothetical protein